MKRKILFFLFLFLIHIAIPLGSMNTLSICLRTGSLFDGALKDDFLFIASGRGVDIYDISNPNNPTIAYYLDTPGICNDIFLKNNLLYTADGPSGIEVYDVTIPQNPNLLSNFISENNFKEIYVKDSIFSVSTKPNGISLFKYTDSGNIERLSRITLNYEVKGILILDSLLIAGLSSNGFTIYNIRDPYNPILLLPSFSNHIALDIAGIDTLLFIASANSGVNIFSIKDPLSPDSIGTFSINDYILYVSLQDTLLFCTGLSDSIYVLDVNDPSNPFLKNIVNTLSPVSHPKIDETILYAPELSTGELFSVPEYSKYADLDSFFPVTDGFVSCSLAFVASTGKGLLILDIKDTHSPFIISIFDSIKTINAVYVRDTIAYLSCGEEGLYILNVADPSFVKIISSYNTPGTLNHTLKKGNNLFLADGGSGIEVVSIEDINNPILIDSLHLPGHSYDIASTDTIAFVSLGLKGCGIVSFKNPNSISLIDTITDIGFSKAVATNGEYLFIATIENGIRIYDVTSPVNPLYITTYSVPAPVNDIYYENELLFLACDFHGIEVVDVSNPHLPSKKDSLDTPGIASCIHFNYRIISLADFFSFSLDTFPYTDTIPPSPVSNLTIESQDSLIILKWINSHDSDYKGTRLLFRNDTFPEHPNDGTILLDHEMEPHSPDSLYHTGLPGDSTYYFYAVFTYDFLENFSLPALISGISATDTIPPPEVSIDTFTSWADTIQVTFMTPNEPDFEGVRALYDTTHIPQHIHDGEVFFDTSLTQNSYVSKKLCGVTIDKTYYFTFFTKDFIPNFSTGLSDSFRIYPDTLPPGEVSIDTFIFWSDSIEVHFTTPGDPDFVGVRAMYDLTNFPQNPYEGTLFFDDSLPSNSQISKTLGGVILDTTYYFTFFARDTAFNYSEGEMVSCRTDEDITPPDTITEFFAVQTYSDTTDSIKLSWVNPESTDLCMVKIRYSTDYYPLYPPSPDSGRLLYNLIANPADTLEKVWANNYFKPGVRYYFSGFSVDKTQNVSPAAHTNCLTPKLTRVSETYPPEPVQSGVATWLDSVEVSFTAPVQILTLQSGVEIIGRQNYTFRIERENNNRYILIPPAFSSLDTVTVRLSGTIIDSVGNPFDGNGNGIPDSTDDYTWYFYTSLIGDYTGNDTINSEDFAQFRDAYYSQDITKEIGPCTGHIPYYMLTPDSAIDFEDFSIFVMMWNWSLDNKGISEICGSDTDSLLQLAFYNDNLIIKTCRTEGLISGEILLNGYYDSVTVKRGAGLSNNDVLLTKVLDSKLLISFGIMNVEMKNNEILIIPASLPKEITYSYRFIFNDCKKEGKGTSSLIRIIPEKTVLKSIYPNPGSKFNIIYGTPENGKIFIDIFDVTGRKILNLLKERKSPGYHAITWDGMLNKRKLPAGIYFVRLKTKNESLVRNIIILR